MRESFIFTFKCIFKFYFIKTLVNVFFLYDPSLHVLTCIEHFVHLKVGNTKIFGFLWFKVILESKQLMIEKDYVEMGMGIIY